MEGGNMLKVTAFKFQNNDIFLDAMTGQPIENGGYYYV